MKTVTISNYSGYHHNRYDGFNCSWGVLAALGASGTADCFADEDDYPDDDFETAYTGDDPDCQTENEDFAETILGNLDGADIAEIKNLDVGEKYDHTEYWGMYGIDINFENRNGTIICDFDGVHEFECTFE